MRNKVFSSLLLGLGIVGFAALTPTASADPPTAGYRYHYGGAPHWHRHVTPYGVYSHYGNDPHWDHRYYGPYSSYYRGTGGPPTSAAHTITAARTPTVTAGPTTIAGDES
jgi:hypothetical protein